MSPIRHFLGLYRREIIFTGRNGCPAELGDAREPGHGDLHGDHAGAGGHLEERRHNQTGVEGHSPRYAVPGAGRRAANDRGAPRMIKKIRTWETEKRQKDVNILSSRIDER